MEFSSNQNRMCRMIWCLYCLWVCRCGLSDICLHAGVCSWWWIRLALGQALEGGSSKLVLHYWTRGLVVNILHAINVVALRWARLVPGWVSVLGQANRLVI